MHNIVAKGLASYCDFSTNPMWIQKAYKQQCFEYFKLLFLRINLKCDNMDSYPKSDDMILLGILNPQELAAFPCKISNV